MLSDQNSVVAVKRCNASLCWGVSPGCDPRHNPRKIDGYSKGELGLPPNCVGMAHAVIG